ncbi:TPA: tail fiber assembly protein [Proteus mirabilis]|nr:tail fiber assembly protein [Proteus mirabilis]HEK1718439.1 tail fiber assembly protein [Proteus mirabilis]HEK2724231.1 tail fiber assembly protein [Proteus mirabilis]
MIEYIRNIQQHSIIPLDKGVECEVKLTSFEQVIPYFATPDDNENIGREIYKLCLSGEYGNIAPPAKPNKYELIASQKEKRDYLINEASFIIDPLKDASEGGYINKEDIDKLERWKKYRYQLTKVNVEDENLEWPSRPE